jgi:ubiquinone/menaquinone biosynthesis C-methylase UbiE
MTGIDRSWEFNRDIIKLISPFERDFLGTELSRSLNYYSQRVKKIGFTGYKKVLDAGCGIGQWSIALAAQNEFVTGVDFSPTRLFMADNLGKSMGVQNLQFQWGDMHNLPFDDNYFDAIFCNIALMYGNIPNILEQFSRVLKKDGELYVNSAGYGYYLHLLINQGLKVRNYRLGGTSLKIIMRSFLGAKDNVAMTKKQFKTYMTKAGFKIAYLGAEGSFYKEENIEIEPVYAAAYYGLIGILECIGIKK